MVPDKPLAVLFSPDDDGYVVSCGKVAYFVGLDGKPKSEFEHHNEDILGIAN